MRKTWRCILSCMLLCIANSQTANAACWVEQCYRYPFYAGLSIGYGRSTWAELIPPRDKMNDAMVISIPVHVKEGGSVWGGFIGYEFMPYFAVEGAYFRYPRAHIDFDDDSLFAFDHDGTKHFNSYTEMYYVVGKFMIFIPRTRVRAFAAIGIGDVHRDDRVKELWRVSPTCGAGLNYNFTEHIMGEIGFNYTSGYGISELTPADDYVPFLYSGFLRIAYRF